MSPPEIPMLKNRGFLVNTLLQWLLACLQLLSPHNPTRALPLDPAGGLLSQVSQSPGFVPLRNKFLATPLVIGYRLTVGTSNASTTMWISWIASDKTAQQLSHLACESRPTTPSSESDSTYEASNDTTASDITGIQPVMHVFKRLTGPDGCKRLKRLRLLTNIVARVIRIRQPQFKTVSSLVICKWRKRAFHFYSPSVVRRSHAAAPHVLLDS